MSRDRFAWTRRLTQFRLRWLMLLFVPLAIAFAYYTNMERRRIAAFNAFSAMCDKGLDLHARQGATLQYAAYFKYGNVTDADLSRYSAAFDEVAPKGMPKIVALKLNGSPVSADAIQRFKEVVPECRVEP